MYVSVAGRVDKQSVLDKTYDKHLQPQVSVGTGDGEVSGPVKVAGGESGMAGWTGYEAVEGPAVGNPSYSGMLAYCCLSTSKP